MEDDSLLVSTDESKAAELKAAGLGVRTQADDGQGGDGRSWTTVERELRALGGPRGYGVRVYRVDHVRARLIGSGLVSPDGSER